MGRQKYGGCPHAHNQHLDFRRQISKLSCRYPQNRSPVVLSHKMDDRQISKLSRRYPQNRSPVVLSHKVDDTISYSLIAFDERVTFLASTRPVTALPCTQATFTSGGPPNVVASGLPPVGYWWSTRCSYI